MVAMPISEDIIYYNKFNLAIPCTECKRNYEHFSLLFLLNLTQYK